MVRDEIGRRLSEIHGELHRLSREVTSLGMWIFMGLVIGIMSGIAIGIFLAEHVVNLKFENVTEAYTEGYRQGVMDALQDPEQALASILCTGDYNATVTIDGQEFTLVCSNGGG